MEDSGSNVALAVIPTERICARSVGSNAKRSGWLSICESLELNLHATMLLRQQLRLTGLVS